MYTLLRKHPLLPLVLVFIAGIFTGEYWTHHPVHLFLVASTLLLISYILNRVLSSKWPALPVLPLFLCVYFLGFSRVMTQQKEYQHNHFSEYLSGTQEELIGVVTEVFGNRFILAAEVINQIPVRGNLLIYSKEEVTRGQYLYLPLEISEIQPPRNPFAFDFERFYHRRQIWHQSFLNKTPLVLTRERGFFHTMDRIREYCSQLLQEWLEAPDSYSLASALILGDKSDLDSELKSAFTDSGTMHVLAVSGLHVGVVYMILLYFLKYFFSTAPWARICRSILILSGLWFFVFLVGAPTSAWRAALMFSFFETGRLMSKSYYPVNTLSCAAFIMLLLDPYTLFDVGFQLSFLAVLGIVTCQRPIQNRWHIESSLGFRIWQMISLSLAAQIFTFPLTIYYFHQFPIYFWLSGILAVPLAFFILTTGILFLIFSWVPLVNIFLGYLLEEGITTLNGWILLIREFPVMVVDRIWISLTQLFILLSLSLVVLSYLNNPTAKIQKIFLVGMIIFLTVSISRRWDMLHQQFLIAYSHKTGQYIDLILGDKAFPISPPPPDEIVPFDITNTRNALGVRLVGNAHSNPHIFQRDGFYAYDQIRIYCPDSILREGAGFPEVDILFLDHLPERSDLHFLSGETNICLSGRIPYYRQQVFQEQLNVHHTLRDGALTINLKQL